jgi:hypothetical protein
MRSSALADTNEIKIAIASTMLPADALLSKRLSRAAGEPDSRHELLLSYCGPQVRFI